MASFGRRSPTVNSAEHGGTQPAAEARDTSALSIDVRRFGVLRWETLGMPESESAAESLASSASETLSQLLARILDQLALSAWLPSAALTLSMAFIFQLRVGRRR